MKTLQEKINEANDTTIENEMKMWFSACLTQDDYQRKLKEISYALYKVAQNRMKIKSIKTMPGFAKAANQFAMAVNSIRFEIDEVLNNDKIWRE